MTSVDFIAMTDLEHQAKLVGMMSALYAEDEAASPVDHAHFPFSVQFLVANPSRGRVVLFSEGGTICGYALLIPYWSNEFGGILLFVDEIFVAPERVAGASAAAGAATLPRGAQLALPPHAKALGVFPRRHAQNLSE
jgi:hypothetical protein